MAHVAQIGLSHVPLRFPGTFQSQRRVPGRPQAHFGRRRELHTMAWPPPGRLMCSHATARHRDGIRIDEVLGGRSAIGMEGDEAEHLTGWAVEREAHAIRARPSQ